MALILLVALVVGVSLIHEPRGIASTHARGRPSVAGEAPGTKITRAPSGVIDTVRKKVRVRFRFRATERGARFRCRIDGGRWRACRSPARRWVGPGRHRFAVRSRDRQGNADPTEARRRWRVERWRPDVRAARRYARGREGPVSFAVDLGWRQYGFRKGLTAPTASSIKAMLMVAYLRGGGVRHRDLDAGEKDLLGRMIRLSDNGAASTVRNLAGEHAIRKLARKAGMRDFEYSPVWGICRTSARDQASFMRNIEHYVPDRHRPFVRRVLAQITESQRWGVAEVQPRGWSLRFKGGWGISDGRHGGTVNHQIAVLQHGRWRVGLAILTQGNSTTAGGQQTLRGVASRLLRRLPH